MPLSEAFRRVPLGEQPPEPPEWLKTWSSQTFHGLLGGMLFGGYRGLLLARDPALPSPTESIKNGRHRAAAFFVRESILTGSRIGLFVSVFSAASLAMQSYSAQPRAINYAASGATTCGLFSAAMAGARPVLPVALFGAVTAGAAGSLQDALDNIAGQFDEEEKQGLKMLAQDQQEEEEISSVAMVISRYESMIEESRRRREEEDQQINVGNQQHRQIID